MMDREKEPYFTLFPGSIKSLFAFFLVQGKNKYI